MNHIKVIIINFFQRLKRKPVEFCQGTNAPKVRRIVKETSKCILFPAILSTLSDKYPKRECHNWLQLCLVKQ